MYFVYLGLGALFVAPLATASLSCFNASTVELPIACTVQWITGQYANDSNKQTYMEEQMYVERLSPATPTKQVPLVFIHESAVSGSIWLNTPDCRRGWASYFLEQGYVVYIVDQPRVGRSSPPFPGPFADFHSDTGLFEFLITASKAKGNWPQAVNATQFPGTGLRGDPIFDTFMASAARTGSNFPGAIDGQELLVTQTLTELLKSIGPAILFGHSASGVFPWLVADRNPELLVAMVQIEPGTAPFEAIWGGNFSNWGLTSTPLNYTPPVPSPGPGGLWPYIVRDGPPSTNTSAHRFCWKLDPPRNLTQIAKVPQLIVTGGAGVHATFEHCTVNFLKAAGVDVEWWYLPDKNLYGNNNYMMIEMNNLDIAALIGEWIAKNATQRISRA